MFHQTNGFRSFAGVANRARNRSLPDRRFTSHRLVAPVSRCPSTMRSASTKPLWVGYVK